MLIEVINQDCPIMFNLRLAQAFGVEGAIYCSELINIYHKAIRKNRLIDGAFCKLDRNYIFKRTTITIQNQLEIDSSLMKVNVMEKHIDNPDCIRLDIKLLISIMASEEIGELKNVKKACGVLAKEEIKERKVTAITKALKNSLKSTNQRVREKLEGWIDSIMMRFNGAISKSVVQTFEEDLMKYTSDEEKQLNIIKIATTQSYKNCEYAISYYEKSEKMRKQNESFFSSLPRVTEQRKATKDSLGKTTF